MLLLFFLMLKTLVVLVEYSSAKREARVDSSLMWQVFLWAKWLRAPISHQKVWTNEDLFTTSRTCVGYWQRNSHKTPKRMNLTDCQFILNFHLHLFSSLDNESQLFIRTPNATACFFSLNFSHLLPFWLPSHLEPAERTSSRFFSSSNYYLPTESSVTFGQELAFCSWFWFLRNYAFH